MLYLNRVSRYASGVKGLAIQFASLRSIHTTSVIGIQHSSVLCEERGYRAHNKKSFKPNDRGFRDSGNRKNYRDRGRPQSSRYNGSKSKYDREESDVSSVFKGTDFNVTTLGPESFKETVTIDSLLKEKLLDESIHRAIFSMNFESLTPVQQRTIKPILESSNDIAAKAKTGTGKTLAFLIPIFQHLVKTKLEAPTAVKAVIIAPTRDLAIQISAEIKLLQDSNNALKSYHYSTLIGGTNLDKSLMDLSTNKPNIIVGTPGRINDIVDRVGPRFFKNVDFKVLDEADTLLQIGFLKELSMISKNLNELNVHAPDHIRTLLFSATMDKSVKELARTIFNKKECTFIDTVDKNASEAHERIEQKLVITETFGDSMVALIGSIQAQLEKKKNFKAILFLPTVRFVDFFGGVLNRSLPKDMDIIKFHGKIDQKKRTKLVGRFKRSNHGLFVCTDVGARGMHFPDVEHVYQLCVPTQLPNYIHRIGRTARAGNEGAATIFLFKDELKFVDQLKRSTNVVIKNQSDYHRKDDERWETIASCITSNRDFPEALKTIVGFYKGAQSEYGFSSKAVENILRSYSELHGDPSVLLQFTRHQLNNYFSNRDLGNVADLITVKKSYSHDNNRGFDDDFSSYNSRQNSHKPDRFTKSNRFEDRNVRSDSRRRNNYSKSNFSFDN